MIKTEVVRITPAIAEEWLQHRNITNRSLSRRSIAMMVDDMREGRWQVTGEAIIFDANGRLTNGHHRLNACMKAGVPFTSLVVRGVEPAAVFVQDTGRARTASNMAAILEVPQGKHATAAARLLLCYETGDMLGALRSGVGSPTKTQIVEDCLSRPKLADSIAVGRRCEAIMFPAVAVACHWLFCQRDEAKAHQFFEKIYSGAGMDEADPALRLRERLVAQSRKKTSMDNYEMMALAIKAWNLIRAGRTTLRRLDWRNSTTPDEAFPVVK
jgi:hypothetical protein